MNIELINSKSPVTFFNKSIVLIYYIFITIKLSVIYTVYLEIGAIACIYPVPLTEYDILYDNPTTSFVFMDWANENILG